jgi:hypothetical protein
LFRWARKATFAPGIDDEGDEDPDNPGHKRHRKRRRQEVDPEVCRQQGKYEFMNELHMFIIFNYFHFIVIFTFEK